MNKLIYLLVIIVLLGAVYLLAPEQDHQSQAGSIEEGIVLAREQNKMIFLYITADWCTYCHVIEKEFTESEKFQQIMDEHYIWVTLDFDKNPTLMSNLGLRGPPAFIVLDQSGDIIAGIPGYPPNGIRDVNTMLEEALQ